MIFRGLHLRQSSKSNTYAYNESVDNRPTKDWVIESTNAVTNAISAIRESKQSRLQCKQHAQQVRARRGLRARGGGGGGGGLAGGAKTDLIAVAIYPDLFYQVTGAKVHL